MRLAGELTAVHDLGVVERAEMLALMQQCYENVNRAAFERDLLEKQWVILLRDATGGRVCGFSTQVVWRAELFSPRLSPGPANQSVSVLFSGDTVVAPDCWGDHALSHVWGRLAMELIDREPAGELYWFLISKGYKTYRYLPLFFYEFYPRRDHATPVWAREICQVMAGSRFPDRYDPVAGIVRASASSDRVRAGIADIDAARLRNPDVQFFLEKNPQHARGDELCCLAPLTRENFTPAAYRVIGATQPAPALPVDVR